MQNFFHISFLTVKKKEVNQYMYILYLIKNKKRLMHTICASYNRYIIVSVLIIILYISYLYIFNKKVSQFLIDHYHDNMNVCVPIIMHIIMHIIMIKCILLLHITLCLSLCILL